ncbi:hypothetical protein LV457_10665 [Mycobacterium sp. MYCO198283]|uniref:hypothetical protein n=1 Tax=Mycobacterium sp. MYCO198283 TaxID=2883505 RepID=UPI001E3DABA1|nr:hypothetical protein [Mycobacterium sp. MYCO198283]MCG5432749.1 hypothetical protein [Mycobacterium sp. MYCO198283]
MTLQLPASEGEPSLYSPDTARSLMMTAIEIFTPDHANWMTPDIEQLQKSPNQTLPDGSVKIGVITGRAAGWATYLKDGVDAGFDQTKLPNTAALTPVANGTLVTLGDDSVSPPPRDILSVRTAMGYGDAAPESAGDQASLPPVTERPRSAGLSGSEKADVRPVQPARDADERQSQVGQSAPADQPHKGSD